ncbi:MAG: hypothetical protein V1647_01140 [Pseudomonadota bacterium]
MKKFLVFLLIILPTLSYAQSQSPTYVDYIDDGGNGVRIENGAITARVFYSEKFQNPNPPYDYFQWVGVMSVLDGTNKQGDRFEKVETFPLNVDTGGTTFVKTQEKIMYTLSKGKDLTCYMVDNGHSDNPAFVVGESAYHYDGGNVSGSSSLYYAVSLEMLKTGFIFVKGTTLKLQDDNTISEIILSGEGKTTSATIGQLDPSTGVLFAKLGSVTFVADSKGIIKGTQDKFYLVITFPIGDITQINRFD